MNWLIKKRKIKEDNTKHHVIISGTGRAGTTFLVQLLTSLGLDTGFDSPFSQYHSHCNAGMEQDIRDSNAPYIIKSPWLCDYIEEVLINKNIVIDHAFIPIRDLFSAAESRRYIERNFKNVKEENNNLPGGLWHTEDPKRQEEILANQLYKLIFHLTLNEIPFTFLHFPKIATDSEYLYNKLKDVFKLSNKAEFTSTFNKVSNPDLIHNFKIK